MISRDLLITIKRKIKGKMEEDIKKALDSKTILTPLKKKEQ
jgi:hypothetical protein